MTKKVNTELARIRAAARTLRAPTEGTAVATVQPAIAGTLADARAIVARELEFMRKAQDAGTAMELKDAKKLQALMSTLGSAQIIERAQTPDLEELSDEDLARELKALQGNT